MTPPRLAAAFELIVTAIYVLLVSYQLFIPPITGLANNGDFDRVMEPFGLGYTVEASDDRYFRHVVRNYSIERTTWHFPGYVSSVDLMAVAAVETATLFSRDRMLDIRLFGFFNMLCTAAGIWLLMRATRRLPLAVRIVAASALLFFFSDLAYVAPMNSMYSGAASVAFLLCATGALANAIAAPEVRAAHLIIAGIFAILFVTSKPQEAVHAPLFACAIVAIAYRARRFMRVAFLLAVAILCAGVFEFRSTPPFIKYSALYHAIFFEMAAHSPTPVADLRELGFDEWMVRYRGTNAYEPGSGYADPRVRAALERTSQWQYALFLARHPSRAVDAMRRASRDAIDTTQIIGTAEKGETTHAFRLWTAIRSRASAAPLPVAVVFIAAAVATFLWLRRAGGPAWLFALIAIVAAIEFAVCGAMNAHIELQRILVTFYTCTDLMLAAMLATASSRLVSGANPRRSPADDVADVRRSRPRKKARRRR